MVLITGLSGFVGKNLSSYFLKLGVIFEQYPSSNFPSNNDKHKTTLCSSIASKAIVHLAGKAHDLKNVSVEEDYYSANTELTKTIFEDFLKSDANVFITISSVKAVADEVKGELFEDLTPNPITHYGKSKLLAEQFIFSKQIPLGKRVYILRPCMIHGPGNKGNLNLLFSIVSKGLPWPLGSFDNSRSYLSIENLCFIVKELIDRNDIPSGVYNVADDVPLSTNEVIKLISESKGKKARILNISKCLIKELAHIGDLLKLPLNSERLKKLTESYIVSNAKIKNALGKSLPVSSKEGLIRTFQSFVDNA